MADTALGILRWVVSQRLGDSSTLSGSRRHPPAPSPNEKEALQLGENLTFPKEWQ